MSLGSRNIINVCLEPEFAILLLPIRGVKNGNFAQTQALLENVDS